MPRVSTLVEDFSGRFNFEPTKVASLARALREAGLLTQGARGVNAPKATVSDAARLLLAMMLDCKIATVAQDVSLFESFKPVNSAKFSDTFAPQTLGECLAGLIDYFGSTKWVNLDGFNAWVRLKPYVGMVEVGISQIRDAEENEQGDDDGLIERDAIVTFVHPDITMEALEEEALPLTYTSALTRFPTGFYQEPELRTRELLAIGQIVAERQPMFWCPQ